MSACLPRPAAVGARPRRRRPDRQRGSVSLWLLGVCVMLLFLGGVSLDLWRAYGERRALAALADAAAVAGAQALDVARFRASGEVALDAPAAEQAALAHLAELPAPRSLTAASASADERRVRVTVAGEVPLTLLAVLLPDAGPVPLRVTASAAPRAAP